MMGGVGALGKRLGCDAGRVAPGAQRSRGSGRVDRAARAWESASAPMPWSWQGVFGAFATGRSPGRARVEVAMRYAAAISDASDLQRAIAEACGEIQQAMAPERIALLIAAVTPHHAPRWSALPQLLRAALSVALADDAVVIGSSAPGVIGDGHEVEQRAGLSLWAASLPGAACRSFAIVDGGDLAPAREALAEATAALSAGDPGASRTPASPATLLLFVDPSRCPSGPLLTSLRREFPAVQVAGVLAGGGGFAQSSAVFLDDAPHSAVGVVIAGGTRREVLIAQGCRPIGAPRLITRCRNEMVEELDGERPVEVLRNLYESLDGPAQIQFRNGLRVGLEQDPDRIRHDPGQMVMRPLRGVDAETGAMLLPEAPHPWQVVQFHVRDAHAAHDALVATLAPEAANPSRVKGVWMVSCIGRGLSLYGRPGHDTDLVREAMPDAAIGGCFGLGELGGEPSLVHLHSFATLLLLFVEDEAAPRIVGAEPGP